MIIYKYIIYIKYMKWFYSMLIILFLILSKEFAESAKGLNIRSQTNVPHKPPLLVLSSGATLLISSTSSSLQTHTQLQTPVVLNSIDNNVTFNHLQQSQLVPRLNTQFSVLPGQSAKCPQTLPKQSERYRKILPSKSMPKELSSDQTHPEVEAQVEMSVVNENDPSNVLSNVEEPIHVRSPSHKMASSEDSAAPESISKTAPFDDSPSVFPTVSSPVSASTPTDSRRAKLPTVRNLGPEFDKHDSPSQSFQEGDNVATDIGKEGNQNTSVHGASLIDPDLILPHSPPKKLSQAANIGPKFSEETSLQDAPSDSKTLEKNEPNADARLSPPVSSGKGVVSSRNTVVKKKKVVTKADSDNVNKLSSRTLGLTGIEKPSVQTSKKSTSAETSETKSSKKGKPSRKKKDPESMTSKEKEDRVIETKSTVQSPEDKVQPHGMSQSERSQPSIMGNLEKNIFEMIRENISYTNRQANTGVSNSETEKDSNQTSDQSVPNEKTKSPQTPTFVVVTAKPSPPSLSLQLEGSPIKVSTTDQQTMSSMKTPTKLRPLAPKESLPVQVPTYVPLPKISPKRKELNRQVRHILPKSFVFEAKNPSPTKATAMVLKKKALCQQRSPVKILPRPAPSPPGDGEVAPKGPGLVLRRSTRHRQQKIVTEEKTIKVRKVPPKETEVRETPETEEVGEPKGREEKEDQMKLEDLMAASTTISFATKQPSVEDDMKGRTKKQRELALLQPDLVESDPKKDERDIAFAQGYFDQVKEVLKDDPERFRSFLNLLKDMNKNHRSPVELYTDIVVLLSDHQQLVEDFAGFLLSFQALECQCFISSHQINQIRKFLRQVEIHCGSSASTFQKALHALGSWLDMYKDGRENVNVREKITSILRNIPGVLDDLICYFLDGPLPACQADEFEDVNLEEDMQMDDEFENVVLPNEQENYNTRTCSCQCHSDSQDENLLRRRKHCVSCSLKMQEGEPILRTSLSKYHPLSIIYPLEEKEKLIKARKEAAQIALAKAKAQKQKGKKEKPVQKIKSKKTSTDPEKLKRKKESDEGVTPKKKNDADGSSENKLKEKPSDSKGTAIKIRNDRGKAKLATSSNKDSEKKHSNKGEDSSSFSTDQNPSTEPATIEDKSTVSGICSSPPHQSGKFGLPRKSQSASVKDSQVQKSSRSHGKSGSGSVSSRKRGASHSSQSESSPRPPSKKRAVSPVTDTATSDKQDFIPVAICTQNIIGQDKEASIAVCSPVPVHGESSSMPQDFGSGLKSQIAGNQTPSTVNVSSFSEASVDSGGVSDVNEEFDRCILDEMSYDGITEEGVKAVRDLMPMRTAWEIKQRAQKILEMLEGLSDATTETDLEEEDTKK